MMMDKLAHEICNWHEYVVSMSGKGDATNWSIFSWAVEVSIAKSWCEHQWDKSHLQEVLLMPMEDPEPARCPSLESLELHKWYKKEFLQELDPEELTKVKLDEKRRKQGWSDTQSDWYNFRVQGKLDAIHGPGHEHRK